MRNDLALVFRGIMRAPVTPLLAMAALCVGIAVAAAIFTVVDGVLLRGLPYPDSDRLVLVWRGTAREATARGPLSPPDYLDVRDRVTSFAAVAAVNSFSATYLPDAGDPEQVQLGVIAGDFFGVIGARPFLGRTLETADDRRIDTRDSSAVGVIVLAHGFWTRALGADRGVLGRTIDLGGYRSQVVGVMPEGFRLHLPAGAGMSTDVVGWVPLGVDYATAARDGAYLKVIARLASGATVESARSELAAESRRLREEIASHRDAGTVLRPVPLEQEVTAHIRPVLVLLASSGMLLLAVACVNAASLLLVRFMGRAQELAIRRALGAGERLVMRPLLLESALVAFGGTIAGVLLAGPAVRLLLALEPGIVPRTAPLGVDGGIVLFALALAIVLTAACGLGPAWLIARGDQSSRLRSQRATASRGASAARRGMIVLQCGAAFALLYVSASLVGTLVRLDRASLGFEPDRVLTARVTLPFARYPGPERWIQFFDAWQERLASAGGVDGVALTSDLPASGDLTLEPYAPAELVATTPWGTYRSLNRIVSPGYFTTMGVPLRAGREFTTTDREGATVVLVVDEALARTLTAQVPGPVLGRRLTVTVHEFRAGYRVAQRTGEIIGVVGTVPHEHPDASPPGTVYMPHAQYPLWSMVVTVRGVGVLPGLGVLRSALDAMDRQLPLSSVQPLERVVDEVMAPTRFVLALIGIFAVAVIVLATSGLFGVVADTVRKRRRELAVRLAVGASPGALSRRMLTGGVALAALGMLPGALLAPAVGRLLERSVMGTDGFALIPFGVAAVGLVSIAAAACFLPAWRAGRIDPMTTLREE
jgi:putative ABC transport system permease protein